MTIVRLTLLAWATAICCVAPAHAQALANEVANDCPPGCEMYGGQELGCYRRVGTGNLVRAVLAKVDTEVLAYEINRELCTALEHTLGQRRARPSAGDGILGQLAVCCADFLQVEDFQGQYPRILMNPPFENGQDIAHIKHAIKFLAAPGFDPMMCGDKGGRLVAICANGPRQQAELKPLATTWEELPEGSFAEAGTNVRTVLLTIDA
jgi:hypothetical protein